MYKRFSGRLLEINSWLEGVPFVWAFPQFFPLLHPRSGSYSETPLYVTDGIISFFFFFALHLLSYNRSISLNVLSIIIKNFNNTWKQLVKKYFLFVIIFVPVKETRPFFLQRFTRSSRYRRFRTGVQHCPPMFRAK